MDELFECPQCGALHNDPADARLGLRVACLDCEIAVALVVVEIHEEEVREAA